MNVENIEFRYMDLQGNITDSKIYFIPCPLGVNPNNHNNIQCFGDSTGTVGRVKAFWRCNSLCI